MSLATRCPVCNTAFRVHSMQLAARSGKVRCGKCGTVFDGVSGLVEESSALRVEIEPSPQLALFGVGADPAEEPAFLRTEPPAHRLAWGLAALAALLVLVLHAAFHYRTEVVLLVPEARAQVAALCSALGCELRLPRRTELMSIESSDLQSDSRRENVIVLNAVLRNRAPFPQEYPALELTLTDERDQPVLRRVLTSDDYLRGAVAEARARGIAAGGESVLRVHLDTSGARAVGYRLYLFYPE